MTTQPKKVPDPQYLPGLDIISCQNQSQSKEYNTLQTPHDFLMLLAALLSQLGYAYPGRSANHVSLVVDHFVEM